MEITDLPLDYLKEAPWNPNRMDENTLLKLKESIRRYSVVENLVVRPIGHNIYEILSGNQRLTVFKEAGYSHAPCVIVNLDDNHARLLAQALNHIRGEDDLGLRAELLQKVLETIPESEVLAILPETAGSLKAFASMTQETIADYLRNWQQAKAARLKHLQFQLNTAQLEVVQAALARILPQARQVQLDNPNERGNALFLLCKAYLESEGV